MWALRLFRSAPVPAKMDSLDGANPELCINLFERGLNFGGVKQRLRSVDQEWMESFLEQGGLFTLFDTLRGLRESGMDPVDNAVKVLDCVGCIKAVLNSQAGLEYFIQSTEKTFINVLSEGIYNNLKR